MTGLAAFKRLPNGNYKYVIFQSSPFSTNSMVVTANQGTNSEKNYGVFFGILTDEQPTNYLITVDGGKEFTDTFQKNKYFIRVYDLKTQTGFGMRPIYN